jgi:hypothetical protein
VFAAEWHTLQGSLGDPVPRGRHLLIDGASELLSFHALRHIANPAFAFCRLAGCYRCLHGSTSQPPTHPLLLLLLPCSLTHSPARRAQPPLAASLLHHLSSCCYCFCPNNPICRQPLLPLWLSTPATAHRRREMDSHSSSTRIDL